MTQSPSRRRRLRWLERILLLIGVLCLGSYAYAILDSRISEIQENRRLEQALAARADEDQDKVRGPVQVPPQEDRALAAFQEDEKHEGKEKAGPGDQEDSAGRNLPDKPPLPASEDLIGRIEVPRLGVAAIVRQGLASRTLRRGVGHIPNTSLPWEPGNVGIAGHRDRAFRGLKDIGKNDIIELTTLEGIYRYQVEWIKVVTPRDTHVLEDDDEPTLTLVTCYPFYYVGSAPKRFIVRARQIDILEPAAGTEKDTTGEGGGEE